MAETSAMSSRLTKCRHYMRVFITHLFSHVGLCGLVVGYAIVGALTFESLEAPYELTQRSTIQGSREQCLRDLWNITLRLNVLYEENWTRLAGHRLREFEQEVIGAVKNEGYDGKEGTEAELQWSFSGALLYCITVITTIGYGNIAPKTDVGKVVTIFYALLGIPLMLLCLTNIGDLLARSFRFAYLHVCLLCKSPRRATAVPSKVYQTDLCNGDEKNGSPTTTVTVSPELPVEPSDQRVPMYMVLLLVTAYVCGGAVLFSLWEKWSFLDGAYFCFITLSTIGFGDLVPGANIFEAEEGGQAKLIICCVYLVLGLAVIAMSFALVQEEVTIKCRNLARNLGLLHPEEED